MSYSKLKEEFERDFLGPWTEAKTAINEIGGKTTLDEKSQYWLLRLLFEIHGDLDSLVVSWREMVKMQKERQK